MTSGTDADGIPDADDAVIIKAHSITITASVTCSSLTTEPLANNTSGLNTSISTSNAAIINVNTNQLLTITGDFFIKASDSYNHTTILNGPGSVQTGSLTIGNDITVSSAKTTTLVVRTTTNFEILGNVNLYTNVENTNNNRATFRHDSGTITINGKMTMTQEAPGTATQYSSNLGEALGTLILKNVNPFVLNPLGGTQESQLQPNFEGCTVQYSPIDNGLFLYSVSSYKNLKIDSNYSVDANNITINTNGNLYLVNGIVNGNYTLKNNATINITNGKVVNPPTLESGVIYNVTYAQYVSKIIAGVELNSNSNQLDKLTISTTNGVEINQVYTTNQLIIRTSISMTPQNLFDKLFHYLLRQKSYELFYS